MTRFTLCMIGFLLSFLSYSQIDIEILNGDTTVCAGSTIKFKSQTINGSPTMHSWVWITPNGIEPYGSNRDSFTLPVMYESAIDTDTTETLIVYRATDLSTTDLDTIRLYVIDALDIELVNAKAFCCNDGIIDLSDQFLTDTNYTSGSWAIQHHTVTNDSFDISDGCYSTANTLNGTYTYVNPADQCPSINKFNLTVNPLPVIISKNISVCQNTDEIRLSELLSMPTTSGLNLGTPSWSCIECNGNNFNDMLVNKSSTSAPDYYLNFSSTNYSLLNNYVDTILLQFTFTNAYGCTNIDTIPLKIFNSPVIKFDDGRDLCWDEGLIDLNDLFDVNLTDGYWTTENVTGYRDGSKLGGISDSSMINTSNSVELTAGAPQNKFYLRYHHQATGCYASNDTTLIINPRPVVYITIPDEYYLCETSSPLLLSATPSGGNWYSSDPSAIQGNIFNPSEAVLDQPISILYNYANPNTGCENKDSIKILVETAKRLELIGTTVYYAQNRSKDTVEVVAISNGDYLNWTILALDNGSVDYNIKEDTAHIYMTFNRDSFSHKFFVYCATESGMVCEAADDALIINFNIWGLGLEDKQWITTIYPNPNKGVVQFETPQNEIANKVELYNVLGDLVWKTNLSANQFIIDPYISNGSYIVKIYGDNDIYHAKLNLMR